MIFCLLPYDAFFIWCLDCQQAYVKFNPTCSLKELIFYKNIQLNSKIRNYFATGSDVYIPVPRQLVQNSYTDEKFSKFS